jgi:hypothetical protein
MCFSEELLCNGTSPCILENPSMRDYPGIFCCLLDIDGKASDSYGLKSYVLFRCFSKTLSLPSIL